MPEIVTSKINHLHILEFSETVSLLTKEVADMDKSMIIFRSSRFSSKQVFLKISHYSLEKTRVFETLFNKVAALSNRHTGKTGPSTLRRPTTLRGSWAL